MRVYAELRHQQTDENFPHSVLVFVSELGDDARWNMAKDDLRLFLKLLYIVHAHPKHIHRVMEDFHQTVEAIEIERAKPFGQQWLPLDHPMDIQTCEACEIRYNYSHFSDTDRQRTEPL